MQFEYIVNLPEISIHTISFFVFVYSPVKSKVRARAFIGSSRENELQPFFLSGPGNEIAAPFGGYIQFLIPTSIVGTDRMTCTLTFESLTPDDFVECTVYGLVFGDRNGRQYDLHIEKKRCINSLFDKSTLNDFDLQDLSVCEVQALAGTLGSKKQEVVYDLKSVSDDAYLMIQAKKNDETIRETKCNLFLPKKCYAPDEPIIASYGNLYAVKDINLFTISMCYYTKGFKPSVDMSKDYAVLMFKQYSRGKSGSIVFPEDGTRNYMVRQPGEYSIHLYQAYHDLCEPVCFMVGNDYTNKCINAPNPGTLYFMKRNELSNQICIETSHPSDLTVLAFKSTPPILAKIEQRLYRMADVEHSIRTMRKNCFNSPVLYTSIVKQAIQSAYTQEILKRLQHIETELEDTLCRDIILYIEDNLCNDINIKMMEDHFHRSKSFFSHYFRKNIGVSFAEYIYRAKMAHAKQWLLEREKSISQIAESLNYSDVQAFSHAFKRMEGMSPIQFQKQYK